MSAWPRLLGGAALFLIGLAGGWELRGWKDGTITTTASATKRANASVRREVKADREISHAVEVASKASENADAALAGSKVDPSCPPGVGAVSGPLADELRLEFGKK